MVVLGGSGSGSVHVGGGGGGSGGSSTGEHLSHTPTLTPHGTAAPKSYTKVMPLELLTSSPCYKISHFSMES